MACKLDRKTIIADAVAVSVVALLALGEFNFRCHYGFKSSEFKPVSCHNQDRGTLRPKASRLALDSTQSKCQRSCGNVSIPYPFGLSRQCAQNPYFVLKCTQDLGANLSAEGVGPWPLLTFAAGSYTVDRHNTTGNTHTQTEYAISAFQVEIVQPGYIIINATSIKAMGCRNGDGNASISLDPRSSYWISKDNWFFKVGCETVGSYESVSDGSGGFCANLPCTNQSDPFDVPYCGSGGFCANLPSTNQSDPFYVPFCGSYDCCIITVEWVKDIFLKGGGKTYSGFQNCGFCSILYPPSFVQRTVGDQFDTEIGAGTYGLKLDWVLQTNSSNCSEAQGNTETYECSQDATCSTLVNDAGILDLTLGYFCSCNQTGYQGDGYKKGTGCEDINECDSGIHNCVEDAQCENVPSSYKCYCPKDMTGNGKNKTLDSAGTGCSWINKCINKTLNDCAKDAQCDFNDTDGNYTCTCQGGTVGNGHVGQGGTGCKSQSNSAVIAGATTAGVTVFLLLNAVVLWLLYRRRRRAVEPAVFSAKELFDELQKHEGAKYCKIFTHNDLQQATNDFSANRKLGTGAFGTVFEGTLEDGIRVAVKRAEHGVVGGTRSETKQFINEIIILSQVNHRNLVRLLGCCLETQVPILVYEFISNGDLQEHIHGYSKLRNESDSTISKHPPLNWNLRLKIALETAEALNYLHWGTTPPIYHHDIKCANILLDNDYNVKVADFGLSKLVAPDGTQLRTIILGGTPGYLDPNLLENWSYTDKSDVYSYGIVLLVLLTAQKPVDVSRLPRDQNLAVRCSRLMAEGLLILNLDPELESFLEDSNCAEAINGVAKVAMKCVSRYTDDRPTMKEVLTELRAVVSKSRGSEKNSRESKHVHFYEDHTAVLNAEDPFATFSSLSQSSSASRPAVASDLD